MFKFTARYIGKIIVLQVKPFSTAYLRNSVTTTLLNTDLFTTSIYQHEPLLGTHFVPEHNEVLPISVLNIENMTRKRNDNFTRLTENTHRTCFKKELCDNVTRLRLLRK